MSILSLHEAQPQNGPFSTMFLLKMSLTSTTTTTTIIITTTTTSTATTTAALAVPLLLPLIRTLVPPRFDVLTPKPNLGAKSGWDVLKSDVLNWGVGPVLVLLLVLLLLLLLLFVGFIGVFRIACSDILPMPRQVKTR